MAIDLEYQGSDDNAIEELAALANLSVPASEGTENRIRALAAAADVDLNAFAQSDRNLIDRLAALLDAVVPFVYRLDDDGTLSASVGQVGMMAAAPDYLSAVLVYEDGLINRYSALPASFIDVPDVSSGGVYACQINIDINAEPLSGLGGIRAMAGCGVALISDGVLVGGVTVGLFIEDDGVVDFRGFTSPIDPAVVDVPVVGYEPGQHVIGLYVDASTGKVGYTLNGADGGYIEGVEFGEVDQIAPYLYGEMFGDLAAQEWSAQLELVPSAAGITEPVPAGAKDLYQQVI